ncbi:hypothetical protein SAMN05421812_101671 [Asanoa hainanensis]|uniref:Tetratricopeptide repeat-containing protein n=2 Tax=Asanoa hainanensis TaxID=560556 RepID=A0A239H2L2_9ACTN|nr:hypothetical protein SAMN05421812_101671 [Asanoa hainanensis]
MLAEALLGLGSAGSDPLDAGLALHLGRAQRDLGHEVRALALLDAAAEWDPDWLTLSALRSALQARGQDMRAVARLKALLAVAPRDAQLELAELYVDLGLRTLALDALRRGKSGARRRWRLWWATGGPLWFVRAALRGQETAELEDRLGGGEVAAGAVTLLLRDVLADADRDRAAWLLAEQASRLRLDDDAAAPAAARLLADGISSTGPHPLVLREAVGVAAALGDTRLALRILLLLDPATSGLPVRHAGLLTELGRLMDAWTRLQNGAAGNEFREARAELLVDVGLSYLAVDARGDTSSWRRNWRRLWWRTGGPLWFVRSRGRRRDQENLADRLGSSHGAIEEIAPAALAGALTRAAEVHEALTKADQQRRGPAVATLTAANDPDRPSVPLLEQLAWALYLNNQEEEALRRIRDARALEPAKASLFDIEVMTLSFLDRDFEGVRACDRHAASFGRPQNARATHGYLLNGLGFSALSWDAFGPADLRGWSPRSRRRQWWRIGWPLGWLHKRLRDSDQFTLEFWKDRCEDLGIVLGSVVGPERLDELRVAPDRAVLHELRCRLRWGRANVVARLTAGYAGIVVGGFVVARLASDLGPLWSSVVGVGAAAIILGALRGVYRFTRAEPGSRVLTRVLPAILAVAAAGYAVTRIDGRWPLLVGVTVVSVAAVAMLRLVTASAVRVGEALKVRRIQRADPRGYALISLLDMLSELRRPVFRNELGWRRQWSQTLEQVAARMEIDLPLFFAHDPGSADLLRHRGRRAAAALRELKYLVVAAPPGAWRRVETVLRDDIAALATGSLGRLHATDPPAPETHRRSRRQIAVDALRMLFFAGLPLGVVLAAQPWLRFNETILNWARLLTIGWAVLYVLITVDPTFRDKLRTGFALINLGRGAGDPAQLEPSGTEKRSPNAK